MFEGRKNQFRSKGRYAVGALAGLGIVLVFGRCAPIARSVPKSLLMHPQASSESAATPTPSPSASAAPQTSVAVAEPVTAPAPKKSPKPKAAAPLAQGGLIAPAEANEDSDEGHSRADDEEEEGYLPPEPQLAITLVRAGDAGVRELPDGDVVLNLDEAALKEVRVGGSLELALEVPYDLGAIGRVVGVFGVADVAAEMEIAAPTAVLVEHEGKKFLRFSESLNELILSLELRVVARSGTTEPQSSKAVE